MQQLLFSSALLLLSIAGQAQGGSGDHEPADTTEAREPKAKPKVLYGTASYYAEKFNGRKTANGEVYDGGKFTAACNSLPLGTWIRVTNLSNNKSVVVKTNDRLHPRMTRVVDLSRAAAEKLGYIRKGLTKVKVEVLGRK
ncbi:MAG TPA: septal ring lytic transglycosylase RlpA family protein [Flavisolibacter sp.]|nr:septal ring lytic transglycosylase RlpA family protein [Flavisolibacter sp.]